MTRLLVYTRTTGYRHASIPAGAGALRGMDGYSVDATEDPAVFRRVIRAAGVPSPPARRVVLAHFGLRARARATADSGRAVSC